MGGLSANLNEIQRAVSKAAERHDVRKVYLFGSYARGEAHGEGDLDLCLETGPAFSLFSAGKFSDALQRSLGIPINIVTERSLYPFVRESMMRERMLVYERN